MARVITAGRLVVLTALVFVLCVVHVRLWPTSASPATHSGNGASGASRAGGTVGHRVPAHPLGTTNLDIEFPEVTVDGRGQFAYDAATHNTADRHPIRLLIERAKKQVAQLDERIKRVQSLQDAVDDYTRAWGMKPPKGFDRWYSFASTVKSVPAASMFPMAHKPVLQFLALSAQALRDRTKEMEAIEPMYTIEFVPDGTGDMGTQCDEDGHWDANDATDIETRGRGRVKIGGPLAWEYRCNNTLMLMLPILPKLPDELFNMNPPLKLLFNADDAPRGMIHHDFTERSETYAKAGQQWAPDHLHHVEQSERWTYGWHWTCPIDSPLKQAELSTVLNKAEEASLAERKAFVADFYRNMDVCYNPELREQESFALTDYRVASQPLAPWISVSRTLRAFDITMVPLDTMYHNVPMMRWKDKTDARVFWRGSPTGMVHSKDNPWRKTQRHRLNFFANNQSDAKVPVLVQRGPSLRAEQIPVRKMTNKWFDVGLVLDGALQCNVDDGSCDELRTTVPHKNRVTNADSLKYKYALDVDGNAWSTRFRGLLKANQVVLKSTSYPEWFNELLVPWYHYVPVRHDYGDVFDIMSFFEGAPDGSTRGHDDIAEQIAYNGVEFTARHWRIADMQSFMMLLFLEMWRLMSDDREAVTFE